MTPSFTRRLVIAGAASAATLAPLAAHGAGAATIDRDVTAGLADLFEASPHLRSLQSRSKGVLVFPKITKAGFMVGGMTGDGALRVNGATRGYYNISAASMGFQIGAQTFGQAIFLITQSAMDYLDRSEGWQIGGGPSVVALDEAATASIDSTTLSQDAYAVSFGQHGLMAGLTLEGSKITRINPR